MQGKVLWMPAGEAELRVLPGVYTRGAEGAELALVGRAFPGLGAASELLPWFEELAAAREWMERHPGRPCAVAVTVSQITSAE